MSLDLSYNNFKAGGFQQPQGLGGKIGGFLKDTAQNIAKPFYKVGAMVGNIGLQTADSFGLLSPNASANLKNIQQNGMQNTPVGNVDVPTVDTSKSPLDPGNVKALKSAAGTGVEIGSMLGGGEISAGKGVIGGAIQGAKAGAIVGGGQGMGQSLEANQGLGDTLANTATGALTGGALGGAIGGITGGISSKFGKAGDLNTDHPIFKSNYDANLANATQVNNQAGTDFTNAAIESSKTMSDVRVGLGNQYAEAPNLISKADPNASVIYPKDIVDAMSNLKETKAWSLPDSVREPDFQNVGTDGSLKVNPQQAQDIQKSLNDLKFNSKGDVIVNQQTSNLVDKVKSYNQSSLGHITDAQGNSIWAKASMDYNEGTDAVNALGKLISIPDSPGAMENPTEISDSMGKVLKLAETPQGRALLKQTDANFQSRTGYSLADYFDTKAKNLLESNTELQKALQGNWGHQFMEGAKNPRTLSRRAVFIIGSVLGLTTLGTVFRKQIGGIISGQ